MLITSRFLSFGRCVITSPGFPGVFNALCGCFVSFITFALVSSESGLMKNRALCPPPLPDYTKTKRIREGSFNLTDIGSCGLSAVIFIPNRLVIICIVSSIIRSPAFDCLGFHGDRFSLFRKCSVCIWWNSPKHQVSWLPLFLRFLYTRVFFILVICNLTTIRATQPVLPSMPLSQNIDISLPSNEK